MLAWLASASFRFRPKSLEPLDKGLRLAKFFEALSEHDRSTVLVRIQEAGRKLLTLSGFMAEEAINTNDSSWIRAAIVLHIMEGFGIDYRENVRYLVLIAHAAKKIGVDLHDVTNPLMQCASPRARSYLNEFLSREDKLNSLASFGMKESIVDGRFRFVPT
jgi:hypothetical protein